MKLNTWGCIFDSGEPPMWTVKPMNNQEIIDALTAERDALAAENVRLREALEQWEWRDTLFDDGETHITYCPACSKLQRDGHEADCWMKAALSLHPPTASPSAPEGVSGDSELTCVTCRWCALSCSGRYVEPSACSGCYEVPEHPHWEARL